MLLLNDNHIIIDKLKHLLFGESLLVRSLQPIGETHPLVLSGLQTAILFNHLQPLLRSRFLHLDGLYGIGCIGYENSLIFVFHREHCILLWRYSALEVTIDVAHDAIWRCTFVILHIASIVAVFVSQLQNDVSILAVEIIEKLLSLLHRRCCSKVNRIRFRHHADCTFVNKVSHITPS